MPYKFRPGIIVTLYPLFIHFRKVILGAKGQPYEELTEFGLLKFTSWMSKNQDDNPLTIAGLHKVIFDAYLFLDKTLSKTLA